MSLTSEQKAAVASWVAAGDNLSTVQKKLTELFKLSLTYRDVRFLVDDLDLQLKDAAPKTDTSDVTKAAPPPPPPAAGQPGARPAPATEAELEEDDLPGAPEGAMGDEGENGDGAFPDEADAPASVSVEVDNVTLIPGALASGSVTFSDGVTGKWIVDQYGRPGFTEVSQPGYRPKPGDAQSFMQQLSRALQQRGF